MKGHTSSHQLTRQSKHEKPEGPKAILYAPRKFGDTVVGIRHLRGAHQIERLRGSTTQAACKRELADGPRFQATVGIDHNGDLGILVTQGPEAKIERIALPQSLRIMALDHPRS